MQFKLSTMRSPIGTILLVHDGEGLRALDFEDCAPRLHRLLRLRHGAYTLDPAPDAGMAGMALDAYFGGDMTALDHLPLCGSGTAFQRLVWEALRVIPPGTTTSYGRLAAAVGRPKAIRAVGLANGANPLPIVVPCHRVVGADARLTGYSGGLHRKAWLIDHERRCLGREAA